MNFSKIFIDRPIATSLIMAALTLVGIVAFAQLPVSSLPQIDFPTISVNANLPGADPETMASAVAAPLERQFAQIPALTQMTSTSSLGATSISLQFDLDRNVDAAAQDVQAAISAAAGTLPKNLPNPPNYRKTNPSDSPFIIIGLRSDVLTLDQIDNYVDTRLAQQLSQIAGVGQVLILGEQKPAVRIRIDPAAIASAGISLEDIRTVVGQTSTNAPKGSFEGTYRSSTIGANDQILKAEDYRRVVVAYRHGAPVHISDIGGAIDGIENSQVGAWIDTHPGIVVGVVRLPGANILSAANQVKDQLRRARQLLPPTIKMDILSDRTQMIRASVADIEMTLVLTIGLVVMVIFMFLRKLWATVIPGIAVPLSLIGTFGAMYLLNYSLDNLSLMALTIAVGFVVDDAIVMIENIVRYIEHGESSYQAAVKGASQVAFTIISITFSLIAVFIPLLLMGGIVGRLFHEFAVTVAVAVLISAFVSLTITPTLCARFLGQDERHQSDFYLRSERFFDWLVNGYARLLRIVLCHQRITLVTFLGTIALTGFMSSIIPKGFFPQQDTGVLTTIAEAAQDVSYEDMVRKQRQADEIIRQDPDVLPFASIVGGTGGTGNSGRLFISLKPFGERRASSEDIIRRLRPKLARIEGFNVFMQSRQDITVGARSSRTQYQYTLQDPDIDELTHASVSMYQKLKTLPEVVDVATDQQNAAARTMLKFDRETASRLGVQVQQIDDTLYDAFGQRQVGTLFTQLNQYHVILEVDPKYRMNAQSLDKIYVRSSSGAMVPLSAFTTTEQSTSALSISHQGQFPAVTLSFNLARGASLGEAIAAIQKAQIEARLPASVVPSFQGNAQAFQASLATMPYLIIAALITVYIVLGILYESYIHPLTILSTIPSAGVGALLMLWLFHYPLDMIGLIGIILLIGLVKKNAIMMIDFALEAERRQSMSPEDAIYHAALLRFRPIMMTTMCAIFSGLPLMLGTGAGSEFRRPLGFAIVGGLLLSQALTLFTTPVVYLYLDRLSQRLKSGRKPASIAFAPNIPPLSVAE